MAQAIADTQDVQDVVSAPAPLFLWEYRNGLDAKARVVMPASYRLGFSEGGVLTVWQDACIAAMPHAQFLAYVAHLQRQLAAAHDEHPDAVLREMWRTSNEFRLDIQGRLTLAEQMRDAVNIGEEIRFVGQGNRVELWPAEETADQAAERAEHRDTISFLQRSFDIPMMGS